MERTAAVLAIFALYCTDLEIARIVHTGSARYDFLIWDLFLAWIPFVLAWSLLAAADRGAPRSGLVLLGVAWLTLLPKRALHRHRLRPPARALTAPLWFDVVLIASFAFTGLLLGFLSLSQVQRARGRDLRRRARLARRLGRARARCVRQLRWPRGRGIPGSSTR